MEEYTKKIGQNFIHYTFTLEGVNIGVAIFQKMGREITDTNFVPEAVHGKIIETSEKAPLFGIMDSCNYPIENIDETMLLDNIVNCAVDFLTNYNSLSFFLLEKTDDTGNEITKAAIINNKMIEALGEDNIEIVTVEKTREN